MSKLKKRLNKIASVDEFSQKVYQASDLLEEAIQYAKNNQETLNYFQDNDQAMAIYAEIQEINRKLGILVLGL